MIQLKDFSIGFKNRVLLEHADAFFSKSKLTALIGRNGSGKSTMMKAICGLNQNYDGEILIGGENIRDIQPTRLSYLIAYVNTQRPRISNLKCSEIVALGRSPYTAWHGSLSLRDNEMIERAIDLVGMKDYMLRNFNSLSDGEAQKIMIARAIAQDTPVILLDEPTSFLDLPTRFEIVNLLKKLTMENHKTVIFSTHELNIALKLSDFISLFHNEKLINLPVEEMIAYLNKNNHPFSEFI